MGRGGGGWGERENIQIFIKQTPHLFHLINVSTVSFDLIVKWKISYIQKAIRILFWF